MSDRLIWRGREPWCRSLCVRTATGAVVSYVPGDEVPADVRLPSGVSIEALIAEGKIERVASTEPPHSPATSSIVSPTPPPTRPAQPQPAAPAPLPPGTPHPRSITVDVGWMEATVDSGEDDLFGTEDDEVTIAPMDLGAPMEPVPEPVTDPEPIDDGRPDTAPVRTRGPSKRRKKKGA
jgi:hypothetical protein